MTNTVYLLYREDIVKLPGDKAVKSNYNIKKYYEKEFQIKGAITNDNVLVVYSNDRYKAMSFDYSNRGCQIIN